MIEKNRTIKIAVILQLCILLLAAGSLAVSAAEEEASLPPFPLIMQGSIQINGEPAPQGTEITVMLNGNAVGSTVVEQEGIYGDKPSNRLLVSADPLNYGELEFYVNGIESELVNVDEVRNADPGDTINSADIVAYNNQNNLPALSALMGIIVVLSIAAAIKYRSRE